MSRRSPCLPGLVLIATVATGVPAAAQDAGGLAANQEIRIQQLEGQIRDLNGQIEQLTFQIQQMTNRLDRLVADVDFRLRELEGGEGLPMTGESAASGSAAQGQGAPPLAALPDEPVAGSAPLPPAAGSTQSGVGQPRTLGTMSQSDFEAQMRQLNPNADPAAAAAAAGSAGTSAGTGGQTAAIGPYALPGATADEQYQYAFDLLRQNKYGDAEQALRTFVDQYPEHPLAGNANYWLGETFYVRQDYGNAALTFAEGFQRYPQGGKAPDSLLKLGMSLAALGETGDACKAFQELTARYPNASDAVKQRASREQTKNGCQ